MTFEEYFEENFAIDGDKVLAITLSASSGWRATPIDKDDLKDLWDAAVESTKVKIKEDKFPYKSC